MVAGRGARLLRKFNSSRIQWEHGWPAVHFWRMSESQTDRFERPEGIPWVYQRKVRPDEHFWSDPERWSFSDKFHWRWSGKGIAVNIASFLLLVPGTGFLLEWRRRNRKSFWQVSIVEIMALVALVALPFALVNRRKERQRIWYEFAKREKKCRIRKFPDRIVFLDRLLDYRFDISCDSRDHSIFERYDTLTIGKLVEVNRVTPSLIAVDQSVHDAQSLGVQSLQFDYFDESCAEFLKSFDPRGIGHLAIRHAKHGSNLTAIARYRDVEYLSLSFSDLSRCQFDFPVLSSLVRLRLDGIRFTPATVEWIESQPRLEKIITYPKPGRWSAETRERVSRELPHLYQMLEK